MHEYRIHWPKEETDLTRWKAFCRCYSSWFENTEGKRFDRKKVADITGYSPSQINNLCLLINRETANGLELSPEGFFFDSNESD